MTRFVGPLVAVMLAHSSAWGAEIPSPGSNDPRIRYVRYVPDQVTVIRVQRGYVTRIILEPGEKIAVAATGFSADCAKPELEWCLRADVGTNQIWVKPKDGATFNNLEVNTNKRDYSIELKVLKDAGSKRNRDGRSTKDQAEPMFRVMFEYPLSMPLSQMLASQSWDPDSDEALAADIKSASDSPPSPRNWKYTIQVLQGADDIVPSLVFDDGAFTYFQFAGNREVPSVFHVSADGEEGRVNWHMRGDLYVVKRMSRKFVLRLGSAVIGVFNEAFDVEGVPPVDGTTSDRVSRVLRKPQ